MSYKSEFEKYVYMHTCNMYKTVSSIFEKIDFFNEEDENENKKQSKLFDKLRTFSLICFFALFIPSLVMNALLLAVFRIVPPR